MLTRCEYVQPEHLEIEEHLIDNIYQYIVSDSDKDVVKSAVMLARLENTAIAYKTMDFAQESEFRFVLGSIKPEEYIKRPMPISAITSVILGSSIKEEKEIKIVTQKIFENLGSSVNVKTSNL